MSGSRDDPRQVLYRMFDAAVATARPQNCVPAHLPPAPEGRLIVTGAGKAAAAMASVLEDHWRGPMTGAVVTRYGYELPTKRIEVLTASHPLPDAAGEAAAQRMIGLARSAGPDDLVLFLLSGGGSALLAAPAPGRSAGSRHRKTLSNAAASATQADAWNRLLLPHCS